jgi:hypothetical protein
VLLYNQCLSPLSITTKVVSPIPAHGEVYSIQHYVIKFVSVAGLWFSVNTLVSSTNKTDHSNITEILLKVALSAIGLIVVVNSTTI